MSHYTSVLLISNYITRHYLLNYIITSLSFRIDCTFEIHTRILTSYSELMLFFSRKRLNHNRIFPHGFLSLCLRKILIANELMEYITTINGVSLHVHAHHDRGHVHDRPMDVSNPKKIQRKIQISRTQESASHQTYKENGTIVICSVENPEEHGTSEQLGAYPMTKRRCVRMETMHGAIPSRGPRRRV